MRCDECNNATFEDRYLRPRKVLVPAKDQEVHEAVYHEECGTCGFKRHRVDAVINETGQLLRPQPRSSYEPCDCARFGCGGYFLK